MATSGSADSNKASGQNGYVRFSWSTSDKKTISWNVTLQSSGTYYKVYPVKVVIDNVTKVDNTATNNTLYKPGQVIVSGTHTINHTAAYNFQVDVFAGVYTHNYGTCVIKHTFSLDAVTPSPTNPADVTSLTASPNRIKPDGSFTISWTPGSMGNSTIKEYHVDTRKYTASSNSWSGWDYKKNAGTATSATFTGRGLYSDLVPGDQIQFRIGVGNNAGMWSPEAGRRTVTITAYKDGKIMYKDASGTVREIRIIRIKDANGGYHDVRWVRIKDASGGYHNIDLYYK